MRSCPGDGRVPTIINTRDAIAISTGDNNESISERDGGGRIAGRLHQQLEPAAAAEDHGGGTGRLDHDGGLSERQSASLRLRILRVSRGKDALAQARRRGIASAKPAGLTPELTGK